MEIVMKHFIVLLCISLSDASKHKDGDPMFRCDYRYFAEAKGWLNLHRIPDTWQGAKLRCQFEGAVLASPLSKELGTAMRSLRENYINTTEYKSGNYSERIPVCIYTGYHSTYAKKVFTSVEGFPLLYSPDTKWMWGSPFSDVVGDADALVMGPEHGLFGVNGKKEEYPFMCYKKFEKKPINPCSGTFDDKYILSEKTGSCYKLHHVGRTWNSAFMTCSAEGGYLVIINSEDEANFVKKLHDVQKKDKKNKRSKATYDKELRQGRGYLVHAGFTRSPEGKQQPLTIHGQTLKEAGYNKIDTKTGDDLQCGGFIDSGYLTYVSCEKRNKFVCEKKPGLSHCSPRN